MAAVKKKKNAEKQGHYLVCVNKEQYSEIALRFACHMAGKKNAALVLLHVIEPADYQSIGMVAEKMRKEKHEEAQQMLQALTEKAHEWFGITPVVMIKEGMIEEQIISVVEEDPSINVLIAGAATETSNKSKILPPIVSAIGNKLMVPVIIVPGNLTEQQMLEVL